MDISDQDESLLICDDLGSEEAALTERLLDVDDLERLETEENERKKKKFKKKIKWQPDSDY